MTRLATASFLLIALVAPVGAADKEPAKKAGPSGTWVREVGDAKIAFTFNPDTMQGVVTNAAGATITIDAAYGFTEGKTVFGYITKVEKKGTEDGPSKGELFSFTIEVKGDELTLGDFQNSKGGDGKQIVEGSYKKQKDK